MGADWVTEGQGDYGTTCAMEAASEIDSMDSTVSPTWSSSATAWSMARAAHASFFPCRYRAPFNWVHVAMQALLAYRPEFLTALVMRGKGWTGSSSFSDFRSTLPGKAHKRPVLVGCLSSTGMTSSIMVSFWRQLFAMYRL